MIWHIVNGAGQFLTVGALSSRNHILGWTDSATAEAFRTMLEARDFARWLGLTDVRLIDHHPHPLIPADADTTPVETAMERHARVLQEETQRAVIRKAWGIRKAATAAVCALLIFSAALDRPAAAAPFHRHHRSHHHAGTRAPRIHHVLHGAHTAGGIAPGGASAAGGNPVSALFHAITGAATGGSAAAVSLAKTFVGSNPTGRASLWCADFVNLIEHKLGRPGTGSRAAKSFLHYGTRVASPSPGDIVVYDRRGGGHVGYYISGPASHPLTVSGNAGGNQVRVGVAPLRVVAIIRPH